MVSKILDFIVGAMAFVCFWLGFIIGYISRGNSNRKDHSTEEIDRKDEIEGDITNNE